MLNGKRKARIANERAKQSLQLPLDCWPQYTEIGRAKVWKSIVFNIEPCSINRVQFWHIGWKHLALYVRHMRKVFRCDVGRVNDDGVPYNSEWSWYLFNQLL